MSSLSKPLIGSIIEFDDNCSVINTPGYDSTLINPKTNLVNGIVKKSDKNRFVFSIQLGSDGKDRKNTRPILLAQRVQGPLSKKFLLFDLSQNAKEEVKGKDDPRYVGKLERIHPLNVTSSFIGYALSSSSSSASTSSGVQAFYFYEIPGNVAYLKGESFRTVNIAISSEDVIIQKELMESIFSGKKTFAQASDTLHVSTTELPTKDGKSGVFRLNFGGRGMGPPVKQNMKLQDITSKDTTVQVIAYAGDGGESEYSLDFRAPFNALQTFGFALCQIGL